MDKDLSADDKEALLQSLQYLGVDISAQHNPPRPPPPQEPVFSANSEIINEINKVFGPAGWTSSVTNLQQDFLQETAGRYTCGCCAIVKIVLKNGTYHEDVGYGIANKLPSAEKAEEAAKTLAVSDGLRRALRQFGHLSLPPEDRIKLIESLNSASPTVTLSHEPLQSPAVQLPMDDEFFIDNDEMLDVTENELREMEETWNETTPEEVLLVQQQQQLFQLQQHSQQLQEKISFHKQLLTVTSNLTIKDENSGTCNWNSKGE